MDEKIKEVMGLVSDWGMASHCNGEAALDAHNPEATPDELAYADAWRHGFSVLGSDFSTEYFQSMTQASARMADAFMAERAKRVGK